MFLWLMEIMPMIGNSVDVFAMYFSQDKYVCLKFLKFHSEHFSSVGSNK